MGSRNSVPRSNVLRTHMVANTLSGWQYLVVIGRCKLLPDRAEHGLDRGKVVAMAAISIQVYRVVKAP